MKMSLLTSAATRRIGNQQNEGEDETEEEDEREEDEGDEEDGEQTRAGRP